MHKFFLLSLVVVLFTSFSVPALAKRQAHKFAAAKALPDIAFMPAEQFQNETRLVRSKSPTDEYLAYQLRVPKGWDEIKQDEAGLSLGFKLMNSLVEYESPIGVYNKKSELKVRAIQLQSAVTPERWLLEHMLSFGYHVEYMGVYDQHRAEAIIAYIDKGQSYVERAVVVINGQKALLASYVMPIEAWNDTKELAAQVLDSFDVLDAYDGDFDSFSEYDFVDAAKMRYPVDWSLHADDIESIDHMRVNVLNVPHVSAALRRDFKQMNEIDGRVEVSLVSIYGTPTLSAELAAQRREFEAYNFDYSDEHKIDMPSAFYINPAFEFADIKAYKTPQTLERILEKELWFGVLGAGKYYYFVKMLSPSRDTDYYLWLRNSEVFKQILEGLEPNVKTQIFGY